MWRRPCLLCGGIPVLLCGGLLVFFGGFPLACWVAAALSSWWVGWGWWCHPCQHAVRCRLRDRPCRLLGASRHQGATIGRFLFWVRHVTRAQQSKGGCSGCALSPKDHPNRFFVVPFLYLLWGAPRPQGATIHHHVHCSPCRRPCRLHVGSPGRYT